LGAIKGFSNLRAFNFETHVSKMRGFSTPEGITTPVPIICEYIAGLIPNVKKLVSV